MIVPPLASDCWFLTGPTASGKTPVGIKLARLLGAEILSLDSMAIYRGMDIGTAKPTPEERSQVPHHLIDLVDPHESFSVARYLAAAEEKVAELRRAGRAVLFVGGTPLYLKALLRGLFSGPAADWTFRRQIEDELRTVGQAALHERLAQVDPLSAARLHPNDTRRLVRALEVYKLTGRPISHHQMQFDEGRPAEACKVFVLDLPTAELHERIDGRVKWMFRAGLIDETRRLLTAAKPPGRTARQAVGYREVIAHLEGQCELEEAKRQVKTRTRRFAKRQRTWFRSLSECRSVLLTGDVRPHEAAQRIVELTDSRDTP